MMDSTKFKKLLFEVACCAVSCDNDIDEREVRELRSIDKSTSYFKGIDLSKQLDHWLLGFIGNEAETTHTLVEKIRESSLTPVEQLLVLEIVLRLIYADCKIDEREIEFLRAIRSALPLNDEIIAERFGRIDVLLKGQEIATQADLMGEKHGFEAANMDRLKMMYGESDDKQKEKM